MLDDAVYEVKDPFAYRFDPVSLNLLLDYGLQQGMSEDDCLEASSWMHHCSPVPTQR